jgi:hypothetical protein
MTAKGLQPATRAAQHRQAASTGAFAGKRVEPLEIGVAPYIELRAEASGVGLVVAVLALPDAGRMARRELGIDGRGQIGENEPGESVRIGIVSRKGIRLAAQTSFTSLLSASWRVRCAGPSGRQSLPRVRAYSGSRK